MVLYGVTAVAAVLRRHSMAVAVTQTGGFCVVCDGGHRLHGRRQQELDYGGRGVGRTGRRRVAVATHAGTTTGFHLDGSTRAPMTFYWDGKRVNGVVRPAALRLVGKRGARVTAIRPMS